MQPNVLLALCARRSLHLFALKRSRNHRDLLDVDETLSAADEGLIEACRRYDATKGPFLPFARLWVAREVFHAIKRELRWRKRLVVGDLSEIDAVDEQSDSESRVVRGELERLLGDESFQLWARHTEDGESLRELAASYGVSVRRIRERLGRAQERVRRLADGPPLRSSPVRHARQWRRPS